MRQSLPLVLLLAATPSWAENGFTCRFDVDCVTGGCTSTETRFEIGRAADSGAWVFLDPDSNGAEALALSEPENEVQVFVFHDPEFSTVLLTLYPNGRAVYSAHTINSATDVTTGYGFCEALS